MKTRLLKLALYTALCCVSARSFPQTASPSPQLTTATCGAAVCTWNPFGPKTYTRPLKQAHEDHRDEEDRDDRLSVFSETFAIQNTATSYTLHVTAQEGSRAEVFLNNQRVVDEDDFEERHANQEREPRAECHGADEKAREECRSDSTKEKSELVAIDKTIHPTSSNTLEIRLRGKPGASITVSIIGVDNDPPSIVETIAPPANNSGWNNTSVEIMFGCADATSGIASCPNPLSLASEGLNQIAAGTAFDRAGNSATATVQISIDKTPPTITASQNPAPNAAGWNNSAVTVSFSCADTLSGVAMCPSPVTVSSEGASQATSGTALDKAGNSASTATSLNIDETPPLISISSPANGVSVSAAALQLSGSVSDNLSGVASVTCNGSSATLTSGSFACNVTLVSGVNSILVQAADIAGNRSSTPLSVTFNAIPVVPPKAIFIAPVLATMTVGQTRTVSLVGDAGQSVANAIWTISDPMVVSLTPSDPPQLAALAPGTATLTASFNSLTATMTVNVLAGTVVPFGTPLWSVASVTGHTINNIIHGSPFNPGDPDIYVIDGPNMVRALTADGQQLWAVQVHGPPLAATAQPASSALLPTASAASTPNSPIPSSGVDLWSAQWRAVRKAAGIPNSSEQRLAARRDQIKRMLAIADPTQAGSLAPTGGTAPLGPDAALPGDLSGFTFIRETVPDNSGGIIQVLTTCVDADCFNQRFSFTRIDNDSQQQVWILGPNDGPNERLSGPFAVAEDDTVYGSVVFGPQHPDGSQTNSAIMALDAVTGRSKFTVPVPSSHFHFTLDDSSGNVLEDNSEDQAAEIGAIVVMPDGSLQALVSTAHVTEVDTKGGAGSPCGPLASSCVTSLSDHESLQLLIVQPSGSFSMQPVQEFAFDASGCVPPSFTSLNLNPCQEQLGHIQAYIPQEVIPDGLGGALAGYTVQSQDRVRPDHTSSQSFVRHIDSSGGTQDFDMGLLLVPFFSNNTFESGQSMILGANNVAYGSGLATVAFDVTSGAKLWSTPFLHPTGLVVATSDGRLIATELTSTLKQAASASAIKTFNSLGALTQMPFNPAVGAVAYFDANSFSVIVGGQGKSMPAPTPMPIFEGDPLLDNIIGNRAPVPLKITKISRNRAIAGGTTNLFVRGNGFGKSPSLVFGDPQKTDTNFAISNFKFDPDTGVITADIRVASNARAGKTPIFVKAGTMTSKLSDEVFFFVQIPTSVVGAAFAGSSENIPASGMGALHTPSPGNIQSPDGTLVGQPNVFAVYRNYVFQIMDQDSPPEPVRPDTDVLLITEHLTGYDPPCTPALIQRNQCPPALTAQANNAGLLFDVHGIALDEPLSPDLHFSVTQGFTVTFANRTYPLTTVFSISVGNFGGASNETTTVSHP